jgi:hypothetical protein
LNKAAASAVERLVCHSRPDRPDDPSEREITARKSDFPTWRQKLAKPAHGTRRRRIMASDGVGAMPLLDADQLR